MFIGGRSRVKPRFHLFISDANQQNKIVKKGVNSTNKIPAETVCRRRNKHQKKYTFFEEIENLAPERPRFLYPSTILYSMHYIFK